MDQPLIAQQIQQLLNSQVQQDAKKFSSNLLDDFDYSDEESSPRAQGNTGMNDKPDVPSHLLDALTMIMSTERGIQQLKQSGHVSEGQIQQLQSLLSTRQPQPVPSLAGRQISPQINIYGSTVSSGLITHDHNDLHNPFAQGHSVHPTIDMSLPPPIGGSHINPWSQLSNSQIQPPLAAQHAPLIDISMDAGRDDNLSDIEVIDDRDGGWNDRNSRTDKNGRRTKDKDNRRNRRSRSRSRSRSKGRERGGKRSRRERRYETLRNYTLGVSAIYRLTCLISPIFLRISLGPKVEVLMERGIDGVGEVDQNHTRCAIEGKMTSVMRTSDEIGRKRACPR